MPSEPFKTESGAKLQDTGFDPGGRASEDVDFGVDGGVDDASDIEDADDETGEA